MAQDCCLPSNCFFHCCSCSAETCHHATFPEQHDRLRHCPTLWHQRQHALPEGPLLACLPQLLQQVGRRLFLGQQVPDLVSEGRHKGLEHCSQQSDEVGGYKQYGLVASFLLDSFFPGLAFLQVLVAEHGHFHGHFERVLDLHSAEQPVVDSEPIFHLRQETSFGLLQLQRLRDRSQPEDLLHHPVHQVAQVGQQLVVVLDHKVRPGEHSVALLWPIDQEVVAPDLVGDADLADVVPEDPRTVALGELAVLVVEVLRGGDVEEGVPVERTAQHRGGENDRVEGHVVLAHELVQPRFRLPQPPLLIVLPQKLPRYRDVPVRRVEPHVEDLLAPGDRHRHPPLEVPGDAALLESGPQPGLGDGHGVLVPVALRSPLLEPLFGHGLDLGQVDEVVVCRPKLGSALAEQALRTLELLGTQQLAALVALVALGLGVLAVRTGPQHVAVREEEGAGGAVGLLDSLLQDEALVPECQEGLLGDLFVGGGAGPAEVVERYVEPVVDGLVDLRVLLADLLRAHLLQQRLHLRRSAVLVRPADVQRVPAVQSAEPREHVCAQHAADYVAQVRHVVHVGQGRGYQHRICVRLARLLQRLFGQRRERVVNLLLAVLLLLLLWLFLGLFLNHRGLLFFGLFLGLLLLLKLSALGLLLGSLLLPRLQQILLHQLVLQMSSASFLILLTMSSLISGLMVALPRSATCLTRSSMLILSMPRCRIRSFAYRLSSSRQPCSISLRRNSSSKTPRMFVSSSLRSMRALRQSIVLRSMIIYGQLYLQLSMKRQCFDWRKLPLAPDALAQIVYYPASIFIGSGDFEVLEQLQFLGVLAVLQLLQLLHQLLLPHALLEDGLVVGLVGPQLGAGLVEAQGLGQVPVDVPGVLLAHFGEGDFLGLVTGVDGAEGAEYVLLELELVVELDPVADHLDGEWSEGDGEVQLLELLVLEDVVLGLELALQVAEGAVVGRGHLVLAQDLLRLPHRYGFLQGQLLDHAARGLVLYFFTALHLQDLRDESQPPLLPLVGVVQPVPVVALQLRLHYRLNHLHIIAHPDQLLPNQRSHSWCRYVYSRPTDRLTLPSASSNTALSRAPSSSRCSCCMSPSFPKPPAAYIRRRSGSIAAYLHTIAMSAPEYPSVDQARWSRDTSVANLTSFKQILNSCLRQSKFGSPTLTLFSRRLRRASSRSQGRFVAAMTTTLPSFGASPSICTSSSVLSLRLSSPSPLPLLPAMESISSMKTIESLQNLAISNSSLTSFQDSPFHLLAKEAAEIEKKRWQLWAAMAFAIIVLPVPGGPNSRMPFQGFLMPLKYQGIFLGSIMASYSTDFAAPSPAIQSNPNLMSFSITSLSSSYTRCWSAPLQLARNELA